MGRSLLELTRRQYAMEVETKQLLSSSQGMLSGQLRIAADSPLIMPLVKEFSSQHPGIRLGMNFGNTQWVIKQLLEGQVDIGIMPEPGHDARLISIPFRKDDIIFLSAKATLGQNVAMLHSLKLKINDLLSVRQVLIRVYCLNKSYIAKQLSANTYWKLAAARACVRLWHLG